MYFSQKYFYLCRKSTVMAKNRRGVFSGQSLSKSRNLLFRVFHFLVIKPLCFLGVVGHRFSYLFWIPSLVVPSLINRLKLRLGLFKGQKNYFFSSSYLLTEKQVNDYCQKNGITREVAI